MKDQKVTYFLAFIVLFLSFFCKLSTPSPVFAQSYEQEGYRFRNDDGSESTATWLDNQDSPITQPTATNTRLRMLLNATGDPASQPYQLEYKKSDESAYTKVGPAPSTSSPVVEARSSGSTTSNSTSHTVNLPSNIQAGELLLLFVASDGQVDVNIFSGRWVRLDSASYTAVMTGTVFYKFAEGGETSVVVSTSASEQISYIALRMSGADIPMSASTTGLSTNSNPPNLDTGVTRNYLVVAARMSDGSTTVSAAPSGYGNLTSLAHANNAGGATTNTAELTSTGSSFDPGTFTNNSDEWAAFTVAVPPADTMSGTKILGLPAEGVASLNVSIPTQVKAGDLMILAVSSKYSTTSSVPFTPSGWSVPSNNVYTGGAGTTGADVGSMRLTLFTKIADGTEGGTSFDMSVVSAQGVTARVLVYKVPPGYKAAMVIAGGAESTASTPWDVTTSTDPGFVAGDYAIAITAANSDTIVFTNPVLTSSGVTFHREQKMVDYGSAQGDDVKLIFSTHRVLSGTSSTAPTYNITPSATSASTPAGVTAIVRLRTVDAPIQLVASTNITASGENTTAQLAAPSGKSTANFVAGRIQDDENPTDAIDITSGSYTELEWNLQATSNATTNDVYQFRVTRAGTALDTYTQVPRWTVGPVPSVSISMSSDGTVAYGAVDSTQNTVTLGDTQTVTNDSATAVDLSISSSNATGGTGWSLGGSAGTNTFVHQFSTNSGSNWNTFTTAGEYQTLASNVASSGTQNFDLRITVPTVSDSAEKTITVTVLATAYDSPIPTPTPSPSPDPEFPRIMGGSTRRFTYNNQPFYIFGLNDCIDPFNENDWLNQGWYLSETNEVSLDTYLDTYAAVGFNTFRVNNANCSDSAYSIGNSPSYTVTYNDSVRDQYVELLQAMKAHDGDWKIMYTFFGFQNLPDQTANPASETLKDSYCDAITYAYNAYSPYVDIWQLFNETNEPSDASVLESMRDCLRDLDPYDRLIAPNWQKLNNPRYDYHDIHNYASETIYQADNRIWDQRTGSSTTNRPLVLGEFGNQLCATEADDVARTKIHAYMSVFAEIGIMWWNNTAAPNYCDQNVVVANRASNLNIDASIRTVIAEASTFAASIPSSAAVTTPTVLNSAPIEAYGLTWTGNAKVFVVATGAGTVSGAQVQIAVPGVGTQTLNVPDFTNSVLVSYP